MTYTHSESIFIDYSSGWHVSYNFIGTKFITAEDYASGNGLLVFECPETPSDDPTIAPVKVLRFEYINSQFPSTTARLVTANYTSTGLWMKCPVEVWISIDPEDPEGTIFEVPDPS